MSTLPYEHRISHPDQMPANLDRNDEGMWFTDGINRYTWTGDRFEVAPELDPKWGD